LALPIVPGIVADPSGTWMAEVMVSRDFFQQILDAIAALRPWPVARC
jgi:hypothetical protein